MNKHNLKSCPFCASNEIAPVITTTKNNNYVYRIQCRNCKIRTISKDNLEKISNLWNTRK